MRNDKSKKNPDSSRDDLTNFSQTVTGMKWRKKSEKNIITTIIKILISIVVFIFQAFIIYFIYSGENYIEYYHRNIYDAVSMLIQIIGILYILYIPDKLSYKIPWIVLLAFLPIFAIGIYFVYGKSGMNKKLKKDRDLALDASKHLLYDCANVINKIQNINAKKNFQYITNMTSFPVYENKNIEYFEIGEKYFDRLLEDISKAEKYILLEYFIIADGKLWNRMYEILKQKASSGVEVCIIADEWGSIWRYPKHFFSEAAKVGIEVYRFNPVRYGISNYMNYRDHRKIAVIDGCIAYTGGVNIADEYVNELVRFGHWKDNGIRVTGDVVISFMMSFLQNLQLASKTKVDFDWYISQRKTLEDVEECCSKGFISFFPDGPDNRCNPTENVYKQLLNNAREYVYIYTPYFVIDEEILNAILNASRSGVDVTLVTPHKPDKWYVHTITKSYYPLLLEAGAKVYEYEPGFLHAKTMVADGSMAIVGTANLDYRSMNLNYECSVLTYDTGVEESIANDFKETIQNKCVKITKGNVNNKNWFVKCIEAVLNAFSPLM